MKDFDYSTAFIRNIGWLTAWEQKILKQKRVAIAGMGGVGGIHLLTLARLGISHFTIADFDTFELHNFNRQIGATITHLDKPKTDVMMAMCKDINPEADIKIFAQGINSNNIDQFLQDVDIYIDGMDAFCMETRKLIFTHCEAKHIPFVTAAPIGMGVCYLIYTPGAMAIEDYFRFEGHSQNEQLLRFFLGLSPLAQHRRYLQDDSTLDIKGKRGPSTVMACQLCAGVAASQALKILLDRGHIYPLPYYHVYDAYLDRYQRGKLRFGNAGILQQLKFAFAKRHFFNLTKTQPPTQATVAKSATVIEKIIDLARWAPSAENTQPWCFNIKNEHELQIDIFDSDDAFFDYGGIPTYHTAGILLETVIIAASQFSHQAAWNYQATAFGHQFTVTLNYNEGLMADPLADFIIHRSVNRKKYRRLKLDETIKQKLQNAIDPHHHELIWFDDNHSLLRFAWLNARSLMLRLQSKAAFLAQQQHIEFNDRFSPDKLPIKSTNLDPLSIKLFAAIHDKWPIYSFLNRYLLGGLIPALESEFIPGLYSGAQFSLLRKNDHAEPLTYIAEGRALQRLWLSATALGLSMQPNYFPQALQYYANNPQQCPEKTILHKGAKLAKAYQQLFPLERSVCLARIGVPLSRQPVSRSIRKSTVELMKQSM